MSFRYTKEHIEFLRKNYVDMARKDLTFYFNEFFNLDKPESAIAHCLRYNGILSERTGKFSAGHKPWNTGMKGVTKINTGMFQPGHPCLKNLPIGAIRKKNGYPIIKIAQPRDWALVHIVAWELHYGPVPKNNVVMFKDNDRTNYNIDNLFLMNPSELKFLLGLDFKECPTGYEDSIILLARIQSKIREKM